MANNNKHTGPNVPALRFPEFSGEWESNQIKEIASIVGGGTPDTNAKEYWAGDINWYTPSEIGKTKYVNGSIRHISQLGVDNSSAKILPKGTILLSTRATIGEKSITKTECCTNQGFQSVIPNVQTDTNFCYYALDGVKSEMIRRASGSTFLEISSSQLGSIHFHLPDIREQRKIGLFLSLLDERIETQSKIIEEQETLLKSLADNLISSQIANVALNDCVVARASTMKESELEPSGAFPVFGASGLCGYSNEALEKSDSILVTKDGSGVGTCQYATGQHSFLGTLCSLTAKKDVYLPYIYYALLNFNFASYKTGLAIPHIYFKDYRKATIYCPSYDEQIRIAFGLERLEAKINIDRELLNQFHLQKGYLLSRMFI